MNAKYLTNRISKHLRSAAVRLTAVVCILMTVICMITVSVSAKTNHSTKIVRVGYYENEVFQEGGSEGAVKSGYAYEYYRKLSEYTGWEYEYVYGSFSDLYDKLLKGEVDLLAGLAYKEDRAGLIGYPDEKMGSEAFNLVKHDTDTDISSNPVTLNQRMIGVLNSALVDKLNKYLDHHNVKANVIIYDDYQSLFTAFDNNSIDVLAAEGDGAYERKHAEVVCSFGNGDYYLCVNINRPDLLEELNTAQKKLAVENPHYLNSLAAKYYSSSVSSRAFSVAEKDWIKTHPRLNVGYLNHYLPYSDTDEDGNVTGIVKDVVPEILSELQIKDITVNYVGFDNYDDMVKAINSGELDTAFPAGGGFYYSEQNGIYLSNPLVSASSELVYNDNFNEEDTLVSCAINENNRLQYYYVKSNFPDAKIYSYPSINACLDAVLADEVSFTVLNGLRANDLLKNHKYSSLNSRQLSGVENLCFGVGFGNEALLRLLNRGVNILGTDYAKTLAYRYSNALYHYGMADVLRDYLWHFVALMLFVTALILFILIRDSVRKKKQISATEEARHKLEVTNRELEESKAALSDALITAEHANRAKTTFLNNMSHDIRTPMNAIVGFTAMAATHIDNKDQVQDYLSKISVSSRHLLSLINDVLDMSRIESGKMKIDETDVHLPDLVHDLRTIITANIKSKHQELFIDTQDIIHEDIVTDKLRLSQVLLNILNNAVKFTPTGGIINFRVIEKPSDVEGMTNLEFHVKDNGIGMSEEFKENIFEAFTRERTSTVSGIQGTGLGMAISKNIVDLLDGTIAVNSELGKGSEFIVNIPCRISSMSVTYEPVPELQELRALVADDDTDTCLSICKMLRDIGMRPDWTNYGKEAVIRAKEAYEQGDKFRAYIIDWLMPDVNGIETVRRIRKVIGNSDPIIILTAYDWADIEQEAREAGVTAFCSKPLFMSELRSVLSEPFHFRTEDTEAVEEKADFSGKRVLLAEDNELNQIIAVSVLEDFGFEVDIAEDGQKALDMHMNAPAGYYDIILMDIQMPVMDGYEAAKRIRQLEDKDKAAVPIIAVTANAFEEDRISALESGMNGHLAKPYDIPVMIHTLETILDQDK